MPGVHQINLDTMKKSDGLLHLKDTSRGVKASDHDRHIISSSPVPLKTSRVGERGTLNMSRAEMSSRWKDILLGDLRSGFNLKMMPINVAQKRNGKNIPTNCVLQKVGGNEFDNMCEMKKDRFLWEGRDFHLFGRFEKHLDSQPLRTDAEFQHAVLTRFRNFDSDFYDAGFDGC
ncbi:hypothetical protein TNCV_2636571 [Trichonephila clavipes]|uniref:Uncharacterized protein n=1 Tax=Trichonephila clavipes TaxID=2585209 RepID=A0A8X6UWT7_TRICX|nr:hypothetical protein TNCV_2636571 [Trichonephila clavipes]